MNLYIKYLVLGIFFFVVLSCQPAADLNNNQQPENSFFDLNTFFEKEQTAIKSGDFSKIVSINNHAEEAVIKKEDVINDLGGFGVFDINKRSWLDKYSIDSTFAEDGTLLEVSYNTEDKKLKTKQLRIGYKQGKPQKIEASNLVENILYKSVMDLVYSIDDGYSVNTWQKVILFSEKTSRIEVKYPK